MIVCVIVLGAGVNWALGAWLNRPRTPGGPRLLDHTLMDSPMEYASVGFLVIALIIAATIVGRLTSPILGWITFAGVIVGSFLGLSSWRERRHRRATREREALARQRGWHYAPRAGDLPRRWKDLVGWKVNAIVPFGVVAGDVRGLPFTVFDSMYDLDGQAGDRPCTTYALHLPVAYPRIGVFLQAPMPTTEFPWPDGSPSSLADFGRSMAAGPPELRVRCDIPGFGAAMVSDEVRAATLASGLVSWRIEGRDLLFTTPPRQPPTPPGEIVATLDHLAALAHRFPPAAARDYSAPPTTDIPFAGAVASAG